MLLEIESIAVREIYSGGDTFEREQVYDRTDISEQACYLNAASAHYAYR